MINTVIKIIPRGTNVTAIPSASVSTEVKMTVKLDLSLYDTAQKTAIGK